MRQVTFKDILDFMDSRGVFNLMPDELYLKFMFRLRMHRKLNLETPQCFNDKIQWTKLYDRRPEYTTYVDKYAVKKSVADIIIRENNNLATDIIVLSAKGANTIASIFLGSTTNELISRDPFQTIYIVK